MVELFKIKNYSKTKSLLLLYLIINTINMFNSLEAHEFINKNIPEIIEYNNIKEDLNVIFKLSISDTSIYDNLILHFSTISSDIQNGQQILYSFNEFNPKMTNVEKYSNKYLSNSFLSINYPKNKDQIYLTIKCLKYPCSFTLKSIVEDKNKLNLDEIDSYSLYSENNDVRLKEVDFNKVQSIKNISQFPLKLSSKLPFRKGDNYRDLLFNIKFKWENNNGYNKQEYIDNFYNLEINATIINNNKSELINTNFIDDSNFNSVLKTKVDLSTKTGVLKINKTFINNALNLTNKEDNDDLYLYLIISNTTKINLDNNTDINTHRLECKVFLIYDDCNNGTINNIFINNKIDYDEKDEKNNYNFFLLKLDEQKDSNIFIVEFSSNYALSRGLYVSFLDIEDKKKIKAGDIPNNSSNIQFLKSNIKKGKIYHFEFKLKNNKTEAILCVYAKSKVLKTYNYIFKFGETYYKSFNFTKEVKYYNNGTKSIIELENPFYEIDYLYDINKEIIVRKILNKDKIKKEDLDTIGLIESKYELVERKVNYLDKNIKIEIPKINGKDYYSIIINSIDNDNNGNEIFVFNTINNNKVSKPYWIIILFFGVIPFYLGIMAVIIIFTSRKSKSDLKEEVMKTSFKVSTVNDDLNRYKEEDIDEDNLLE